MKKLTIICFLLFFICACHKEEDERFHNFDMKIVKINSDCSLSNDKFHNPQTCNTVLLVTLDDPKMYVELNDCNEKHTGNGYKLEITKIKWWYNHQVGDTVHFDYLRKDRFFTIDNK